MMQYERKTAKKPLNKRKSYNFGTYEILDYFEFDLKDIETVKSAAYTYGARHGKKFSIHKEGKRAFCQRVA